MIAYEEKILVYWYVFFSEFDQIFVIRQDARQYENRQKGVTRQARVSKTEQTLIENRKHAYKVVICVFLLRRYMPSPGLVPSSEKPTCSVGTYTAKETGVLLAVYWSYVGISRSLTISDQFPTIELLPCILLFK